MNFIHLFIVLGIVCTKYTKAACPRDCSCVQAAERVTCRGSSIVSFPKDFPVSTQTIQLDNTSVTNIPQDAFLNLPNLRKLYINNNKKLRTLPSGLFNLTDLKELELINFNNNNLTSIPDNLFNNLPKLQTVFLNQNVLRKLPSNVLKNLPKLASFDVENNKLTSVPESLFDDSMKEFAYASFANNLLSSLPSNIFTPVKNTLESLFLHRNQFRFLPMNAFRNIGSQFYDLNVHLNPTYCNCSLAEFVGWAESKIHDNGVTCNGVNTPLDKINVTNCAPLSTTPVATTSQPPSTTQVPSTITDEPTTTKEMTTRTQKLSTTGAPFNPRVTMKKQNSTTKPKQPTVTTETDTTEPSTQQSTSTVTTIPAQESSIPFRTRTTESILKTTSAAPDPGDIETQDTTENKRRKTIIIAISATAVVSVVLLAFILCLFHTGILSTRRFNKNKVVIYDAEGNVLMTEKEGS